MDDEIRAGKRGEGLRPQQAVGVGDDTEVDLAFGHAIDAVRLCRELRHSLTRYAVRACYFPSGATAS